MYIELSRFEKITLASKFYYNLNYQYSSCDEGLTQKKWIDILRNENEDMSITDVDMLDRDYASIFALLFKTLGAFRVVDRSCKPHKYDIINNLDHLIEDYNID